MYPRLIRAAGLAAVLALTAGSSHVEATEGDWPGLRGNHSGNLSAGGVLAKSDEFRLEVRWKKPVGSGYSSVVVADDRVIVLEAGDPEDQMTCLNAATGDRLWRVPLGPAFKGANGSFDGPLSTPLVTDGAVIGLSARGRLVSVNLRSGKPNWARELAEDEEAPLPMYGFTTSPVQVGDTVVLQVGAPKKMVIGIDPKTGKTKWSAGSDQVSSQTPAVYSLNGKPILLASGGRNLTGIDPADGRVLFTVPHEGSNGSSVTPVDIGNGQVLLTVDDSFSNAFSLKAGEGTVEATKTWSERSIKNTYNIPVVHKDSVFGFSTRILTCVDPQTGKPRWKSRKPGDGFLIAVDGRLIITTKQGSLHIAEASPSRYEELAGAKVFKDLNWSLPAYADNSVFMRSFGEVARVDIVAADSTVAAAAGAAMPVGPQFRNFLQRVRSAESATARASLVKDYLSKQKSFPITEGDIVHFLYQGHCQDAAVASDVFGARQERRMRRIEGTNLHYFSMALPRDQRANYVFLIDYKVQPDPRNTRATTSSMYAGEMEFAMRLRGTEPLRMSWFAMPEWEAPAFLSNLPKTLRGKVVSHAIGPEDGPKLPIDVYLPPGYADDGADRYPVVYIHDGAGARTLGKLARVADAIYSGDTEARPAILVFLKATFNPMARQGDPNRPIVEQVVPFVDKTYRTIADRSGRSTYGTGFVAAMALGLAAAHPDKFAAVSAESPLVFDAAQAQLIAGYLEVRQPTRVYIEWGRYDMFNPHENWDIRKIGRTLADGMSKNKQLAVTARQINDSTDWRSWRNQFAHVLAFLTTE